MPVVLVENSGRCNKNDSDEKVVYLIPYLYLFNSFILLCLIERTYTWCQVLPNGTAWIPHLVQTITDIALNKSVSIHVDKNLIEGPNPNQRGKLWIPLVFALQVRARCEL